MHDANKKITGPSRVVFNMISHLSLAASLMSVTFQINRVLSFVLIKLAKKIIAFTSEQVASRSYSLKAGDQATSRTHSVCYIYASSSRGRWFRSSNSHILRYLSQETEASLSFLLRGASSLLK